MFTVGPALRGGGVSDPYAGSVLALLLFNDAENATAPALSLGSATMLNQSAPTNFVTSAAARFGSRGYRAVSGSPYPGLSITKDTAAVATPYTLEFSFKPIVPGANARFFGVSSSGTGNLFFLACGAGQLQYATGASNRFSGGVITTGAWHSLCVQYDGSATIIDLNGVRVFTTTTYASALAGLGCRIELLGSGGVGGADGQCDFDNFRWTHGVARYPGGAVDITGEFPEQ